MGKLKWTAILAVMSAGWAIYGVLTDQTDKGVVFGLVAVCFAVLSLNESAT